MIGKTNVKVKPNKKVQYVEYIESTGTQYIDTGIKPTQNTRVEIKFFQTEADKFVYGSRTSAKVYDTDKHCYNHSSTTEIYPQFFSFSSSVSVSYPFNTIYTLKNGKEGFYLNDTLLQTYTYLNFSSTFNMYLFGLNQNDSLEARAFVGKIYYCKIYDNGVLIRDFRPCKDGAGVYCLYDEVEKRYYYNQGTGEFIGEGTTYFTSSITPTSWTAVTTGTEYISSNDYGEWKIWADNCYTNYPISYAFNGSSTNNWRSQNHTVCIGINFPEGVAICPKNITSKIAYVASTTNGSSKILGLNETTGEWETLFDNIDAGTTLTEKSYDLETNSFYTALKLEMYRYSSVYPYNAVQSFRITNGFIKLGGVA